MRLPDCDIGCRRTEAVSDCCLRRHKIQCDRQSCWWVAVCPLSRDGRLNTSFAEYLAFSLIFLIFLQVPHKLCCAPCPCCQKLGVGERGARDSVSSMAQAPMITLTVAYKFSPNLTFGLSGEYLTAWFKLSTWRVYARYFVMLRETNL